jgi:hypothetical protein
MLRLFAFLFTGWWPSDSTQRALGKRVTALEDALSTLRRRHNTLAGQYYSEFESAEPETDAATAGRATPQGEQSLELVPSEPFPETAFQEAVAKARGRNVGGA